MVKISDYDNSAPEMRACQKTACDGQCAIKVLSFRALTRIWSNNDCIIAHIQKKCNSFSEISKNSLKINESLSGK